MAELKDEKVIAKEQEDKMVLMYPGNQLKRQVRTFEETLSAFKVMKEAFFERA